MNRIQLMKYHRNFCDNAHRLMGRKNADYATGGDIREDAFRNFRESQRVTNIPVEIGILIRMSDKLSRLGKLLGSGYEPQVKDENIQDTLEDIVNYSILISAFLSDKPKQVVDPPTNGDGDNFTVITLQGHRLCDECT
jgi:hypothetical protein